MDINTDPALVFVREHRASQDRIARDYPLAPKSNEPPSDDIFTCQKMLEWERRDVFRPFSEHVRRYGEAYGIELLSSRAFWLGVVNGVLYAHQELANTELFIEQGIREFNFSDFEAVPPHLHCMEDLVKWYKKATTEEGRLAVQVLIGEDMVSSLVQSGATARFVPVLYRAHALSQVIEQLRQQVDVLEQQRQLLFVSQPSKAFSQ